MMQRNRHPEGWVSFQTETWVRFETESRTGVDMANRELRTWLVEAAGSRVHGTTQQP